MAERIATVLERRRGGLLVLFTGLILVFGSMQLSANAHSGGGNSANNGCGAYCPSGAGNPSGNGNGNGHAYGKPCAGCVGNADGKNPKGQYPDGDDHNHGYECDKNHGIGYGNPAHSGCHSTTTMPGGPPTTMCRPDHDDWLFHLLDPDDGHHCKPPKSTTTTTMKHSTTTTTKVKPTTTTTKVVPATTSTTMKHTTTTVKHVTTTTVKPTTTTAAPTTTSTTVAATTTTTAAGTTTTTEAAESTTTTEATTTTTTTAPTTTTTQALSAAVVTTTSIPTQVLGENFQKSPAVPAAATPAAAPLARTGASVRILLFWAGLALALGGMALMVRERESESAN